MTLVVRRVKNIMVMNQQTPNQRLRLTRELLQFNQTEFSKALGFKQSHISAIESEKKEVSVKIIYALVNKFKVSANWLLSGAGEMFLTHHDIVDYPRKDPFPEAEQAISSSPPQVHIQPARFYLDAAELDKRIRDLEQVILQEGYTPLYHLCELFSRLLQTPLDLSILHKLPLPAGRELPPEALSPVMTALDLSVFENKVFYFSQLEQAYLAWRNEFNHLFQKLYTFLTHPENHITELNALRNSAQAPEKELEE
jgi:transcriptional regulator with XRE-family HTH domain